jgi:hypothetical protein
MEQEQLPVESAEKRVTEKNIMTPPTNGRGM